MLEEGIPDFETISQEAEPSEALQRYFEDNPPPFGIEIIDSMDGANDTVIVRGTISGKKISEKFDITKPGAMKRIRDYILSQADLESLALDPSIASQRRSLTYTPRSQRQTGSGGEGGDPPVKNTSRYNK